MSNFDIIDHHVSSLVRAVRDGETDGKAVMRALKTELAKAEREVSLEADRLKAFTKDIYLESNPKSDRYEHSKYYWDADRNKDPYRLNSDFLSFGGGGPEIKFGDDIDDWDVWKNKKK